MKPLLRSLCCAVLTATTLLAISPLAASAQMATAGVSCAAPAAAFSPDVSKIWVVVPAHSDREMETTASSVVRSLQAAYGEDTVATVRHLSAAAVAVADERRVVIDDEIAVPGDPRWLSHDPTTVFLHWTTAQEDIAGLIEAGSARFCVVSAQEQSPQVAEVQEARSAQWVLGDDSAILAGYSDSTSYSVDLPLGWQVVGDVTLTTNVVASEIARADMSLRFDVDDRPVATWTLADDGTLSVPLDAAHFNDGFTLDALTTTPILEENDCRDPRHVGRWVDIGTPTIQSSIVPGEIDVARSISGLGQISALTGSPLHIALPSAPDAQTLEIVGAVTAAIGQHGAPSGWEVTSGTGDVVSGSGIVIRPEEGAPASISVQVRGLDVVLTMQGDADQLVQLSQAIADPNRLLYFHAHSVSVDDVPGPVPKFAPEVFRFEDAGYDDRTLRGTGAKSLVYRVHIPAGVPPDTATLALFGSYAPALAGEESTVSVRINGSEEQILAVLDASGQLEVLHTIAPANLRPGLNYVKVTVQLGDTLDGRCSTNDSRWFTVSSASALGSEVDGDPREVRLGVEDARFALAASEDFTRADVVVVDAPTDAELGVAVRLIAELAVRGQGGAPRLVTEQNVDTSRHLVVVGALADSELLAELPIETQGSVGAVAAIPSPFAPGRVLLAFTGGTQPAIERAIAAGLSSTVNDISAPYVLVGVDSVRSVGESAPSAHIPDSLAYKDADEVDRTQGSSYEAWLLEQTARIEAANAPETDARRSVAVGILLTVAVVAGFLWIRRSRLADVAGDH